MKIIISSLFLLFAAVWINTTAQVFQNKEVSVSKLEDNMWVMETADNTCMYIIEGNEKSLLIDTGTKIASLDSIVKLVTQKPLTVVITHIHGDHSGNMNYFKDVYFHPSDTVLMKLQAPYTGKIHFVNDGDVFDLGGTKIQVVHMPAHTPGSIVLLDRKAGNCYTGDAFGSGQVWLQLKPFSPMSTYINSCKRMESLMDQGVTKVFCGHYPHVKKALDKSYITSMRTLAEALDNGNAPEAKPYPIIVPIGCQEPMITTNGTASIVFAPDHLK